MTFNLFGTPPRSTAPVSPKDNVSILTPTNLVVVVNEFDSHIDTAREMVEIRKALLAQQAVEDETTERRYKLKEEGLSSLNTSRTTNTEISQTPSPQRRHRYDSATDPTTNDFVVSKQFHLWDTNEAEKKEDDYFDRNAPDDDDDDDDDDVTDERQEDQADTTTILYNDGATELFKSIEEGMWDRATELLRTHPEQASIWILSTGTVNTTFKWSKWKRLPLHEAARRQPPTNFVSLLIATYPAAVKAVTQFGELPLHLAVECGASPSIVNLLAISHWRGCHETDQSGRTPLDVLQENDLLLDPVEHTAVVDALSASAMAHEEIITEQAEEIQQLRTEHDIGLQAVRQQHDDDLVEEQEKQEKLLRQVAALQQQLSIANSVIARQQVELHQLKSQDQIWENRVNALETERSKWMDAYTTENRTVQELRVVVSDRDSQAIVLADRIVDLQTCIQRLAHWHRTTVRKQIAHVTKSYDTALQKLSHFTNTLQDHDDDLQTLLVDIGVDELPATTSSTSSSTTAQPPPVSLFEHNEKTTATAAVDCEEDSFDVVEDDEALVSRATQSANRNVVVVNDSTQ